MTLMYRTEQVCEEKVHFVLFVLFMRWKMGIGRKVNRQAKSNSGQQPGDQG